MREFNLIDYIICIFLIFPGMGYLGVIIIGKLLSYFPNIPDNLRALILIIALIVSAVYACIMYCQITKVSGFEKKLKRENSKMKSEFLDMLDNGGWAFFVIYGFILWAGFAITHDFMWFNFFDYLEGGGLVGGIYVWISMCAYLYGLFGLFGILWDIFKLISRIIKI